MTNKALVIIDIQNDITKNYKDIVSTLNQAADWAVSCKMPVVYIRHYNLTANTRTFKPDTFGSQLAEGLKVVSDNVFIKSKANALTSEEFSAFIASHQLNEFYVCGADASACVKSTCYNMRKQGYTVHVIADAVTSYNKKLIRRC